MNIKKYEKELHNLFKVCETWKNVIWTFFVQINLEKKTQNFAMNLAISPLSPFSLSLTMHNLSAGQISLPGSGCGEKWF